MRLGITHFFPNFELNTKKRPVAKDKYHETVRTGLEKDGWTDESSRFYGYSIHVGVNEQAKVYLYYDMTEFEIGQRLLDSGIAAKDLVPAFQPPSVRKKMGFAVA